ncbi:hypothetical protein V6N13_039308 [Hibiscus sabdariffa]
MDSNALMLSSKWGGDVPVCLEDQYMESPMEPLRCQEFMVQGTNSWDIGKVEQVFTSRDAQKILDCPIARAREDKVVWTKHAKGLYTTRNRWLHNNQLIPARLVSEYAQIVKGDYHRAWERSEEPVQCARDKKWSKPSQGQ